MGLKIIMNLVPYFPMGRMETGGIVCQSIVIRNMCVEDMTENYKWQHILFVILQHGCTIHAMIRT